MSQMKKPSFDYADTCSGPISVRSIWSLTTQVRRLCQVNFDKASMEDFKWQMDVNFWGVAYGTKAFLPILEQAEWGHIVNISSIFGIIASPSNSAYNASKFAVRGMTEALRIELDAAGSSVSCSCVHPGGVKDQHRAHGADCENQ